MRRKMNGRGKAALLQILLLLTLACCARAELITIAIEATVDTVSDPAGHLEGQITAGSLITGYYTYESTTMDSDSSSSGGEYWAYTPPSGIYLDCNGLQFETDLQDVQFAIGIVNDYYDRYQVNSFSNSSLPNGTTVNEIIWGIEDSAGTALLSDALPIIAPVLTDWDDNYLYIRGGPRGFEFSFSAEVTIATVVPEPMTICLLILGTAGFRRRLP